MAGPKKKSKKPTENESDNESMSEGSESGSYHGQQVSFLKLFITKILNEHSLAN